MAKAYAPFVRKIEIEVENLDMVKEAVEAGADIIMLDNMTTEQLKESIDYIAGRAEIEVSGNVTKENIARLTGLGVNYVSSGALTHSRSYYGFIYEESSSGGVSPIRLNSPTDSNYQNGSHLFPAINTSQNMFDKGSTR